MPGEEPPPRKIYALKPKEFERVNLPPEAMHPPPMANDVFAIRQDLRAREITAGMDELAPAKPRKSKRRRDFWLLLIGGNLLLGSVIVLSRGNIVAAVYAGSGIVMFSLGVTWVMWFIMEDY